MTTGLFGTAVLSGTPQQITSPDTILHTVNIRVVNHDLVNGMTLRLAVCPSGYTAPAVPAAADWIEPKDLAIPAGGVLEDTAMVIKPGSVVVAYGASTTSLNANVCVHGI